MEFQHRRDDLLRLGIAAQARERHRQQNLVARRLAPFVQRTGRDDLLVADGLADIGFRCGIILESVGRVAEISMHAKQDQVLGACLPHIGRLQLLSALEPCERFVVQGLVVLVGKQDGVSEMRRERDKRKPRKRVRREIAGRHIDKMTVVGEIGLCQTAVAEISLRDRHEPRAENEASGGQRRRRFLALHLEHRTPLFDALVVALHLPQNIGDVSAVGQEIVPGDRIGGVDLQKAFPVALRGLAESERLAEVQVVLLGRR